MGSNSEEIVNTRILSENYSYVKSRNNNSSRSGEVSEKNKSSNESNTIIIRCSDDIIQKSHIRMCTTCLKKTDPEYYFSWEFMEFCNILCISKFQGLNFKCTYCSHFINNTLFGKFYVRIQNVFRFFCSIPCLGHFKLNVKNCSYCQRDINGNFSSTLNPFSRTNSPFFCSEVCCQLFNTIIKPPRVLEKVICCVCKQDKSVDILLKHEGKIKYFCAKRCLIAYSFVKLQAETGQCIMCQYYFSQVLLKKYTVYYENAALIFCSTNCQNIYMLLNGKTVSCSWCQNERSHFGMIRKFSNVSSQNVYICSVNCFKLYECSTFAETHNVSTGVTPSGFQNFGRDNRLILNTNQNGNGNIVGSRQFIVPHKTSVDQRNVATMCCIPKAHKNIAAKPDMSNKETQTNKAKLYEIILPTPVPIYVPTPMVMFSVPVPTAIPFPLPVPVPIFIPIAQQSVLNIMDEIETMHNRVPSDPREAELLEIADVIAEETVTEISLKISDENQTVQAIKENSQKENLMTDRDLSKKYASNIKLKSLGENVEKLGLTENMTKNFCGNLDSYEPKTKRKFNDVYRPIKKINLNYTLGMNALRHWLKDCLPLKSERGNTLFKTNILQMSPDELSLALYSFIKELKKPDGSEYAPDTLYYLSLGIQYYLTENGRTENIFFDKSYDKFCNILNKFAEKFNCLYHTGSHFVVTRIEEEHLWEAKQLGYHSPLTLLNTLVYFNTKYYHCVSVEDHTDISFFQILRLWRKKSKSKTVMLRFHPKQTKGTKRVYEQYANETDHTRCPVSFYEFYLSKCPENVKNSNTLFYLQPEQYCTSDSPLWYTSNSLGNDVLVKMINRVKMVKEINIALLTNN